MTAANPPIDSVWVERRGRRAVVLAVDDRYVYLGRDGSTKQHTRILKTDFRREYHRVENADE